MFFSHNRAALIHRPVSLPLRVPGAIAYEVAMSASSNASLKVTLTDGEGRCVATATGPKGVLKVVDATLWWPYLMHERPGFLYNMEVRGRGR